MFTGWTVFINQFDLAKEIPESCLEVNMNIFYLGKPWEEILHQKWAGSSKHLVYFDRICMGCGLVAMDYRFTWPMGVSAIFPPDMSQEVDEVNNEGEFSWYLCLYINLVCCCFIVKKQFLDLHDDFIKWKHFPRYWPFVRGIHRSRWIPHTKASDAELWCFLWSASE